MKMEARLVVITGPMFSGKTTELYRQLNRLSIIHHNIVCITHDLDRRYKNNVSHDNYGLNASHTIHYVDDLASFRLTPEYKEAVVVGIDEGQFFHRLAFHVLQMVEKDNKMVIVSGLNLDYLRNPFQDMVKLIILADRCVFLQAFCFYCPKERCQPALFTWKSSSSSLSPSSSSRIEVGNQNIYRAVCRRHWVELVNKAGPERYKVEEQEEE